MHLIVKYDSDRPTGGLQLGKKSQGIGSVSHINCKEIKLVLTDGQDSWG